MTGRATGSPRLARLLVIPFLVGTTTYTLAPSVALFRDDLGVSRSAASVVVIGIAVGGLLSSMLLPAITGRLGRRRTIAVGLACGLVGVLTFATSTTIVQAAVGTMCSSAGGNLMMNGLAASFAVLDGAHRGRWLSRANAVLAGAGLVAPAVVAGMLVAGLSWRTAFGIVIPAALAAAVSLATVPRSEEFDAPPIRMPRSKTATGRAAGLMGILVLATAAEHATLYWAGDLVRYLPGLGPAGAPLATAALLLGVVGGRVVCGIRAFAAPIRVVLVGLGCAGAGWMVLWAAPDSTFALAGLVVFGFGIAPAFPLLVGSLTETSGFTPERAMRLVGISVGLAVGLAPMGLALVSDAVGIRNGFLLVPLALTSAVAVATVLLARSPKNRMKTTSGQTVH